MHGSTSQPLAEQTISLAQAFASYAGVAVATAALYNQTVEPHDKCAPCGISARGAPGYGVKS
jgi:hypothetical protein